MSFLKTLFLIPAVVSGMWTINNAITESSVANWVQPAGAQQKPALEQGFKKATSSSSLEASAVKAKDLRLLDSAVVERRMRIERILVALDAVAESALTMNPEQVGWIEPVLTDIAERTLELVTHEALLSDTSEDELGEIEQSVGDLVEAIDKVVEPEMSL